MIHPKRFYFEDNKNGDSNIYLLTLVIAVMEFVSAERAKQKNLKQKENIVLGETSSNFCYT